MLCFLHVKIIFHGVQIYCPSAGNRAVQQAECFPYGVGALPRSPSSDEGVQTESRKSGPTPSGHVSKSETLGFLAIIFSCVDGP